MRDFDEIENLSEENINELYEDIIENDLMSGVYFCYYLVCDNDNIKVSDCGYDAYYNCAEPSWTFQGGSYICQTNYGHVAIQCGGGYRCGVYYSNSCTNR